jgi:hypothetical protein
MTATDGAMDPGHGQGDGRGDGQGDGQEELRREGERIAQLIEDLGAMAGAPVSQRVDELVRRLMHLYGTGLANLLRILAGDQLQRLDDAARERLRADELLSSLLVLHGIHPDQEAVREYDPGPGPGPAARGPAASGLVQIDLGRSRGAKAEDEP